jgi:hypothetical protein
VEHLGDAVAGRYVLVAPSCPRAARRQYHAVDLVLDRMVHVRFDPRDTHDGHERGLLHTADGCRVLDDGVFEGSLFVVVEGSGSATAPPGEVSVGMSLAELEALAAAPCAPGSRSRRAGPLRRALFSALAVVAVVSAALTAATLLTSPARPSQPAAPSVAPHDQAVWVTAAR